MIGENDPQHNITAHFGGVVDDVGLVVTTSILSVGVIVDGTVDAAAVTPDAAPWGTCWEVEDMLCEFFERETV